jgi:hypothetical protein
MTTHRTPEARIAALEAQIERIKTRAERAKVRKDPTLRHMRAAVRQIDKAAGACGDRVVRGELQEARTRIAACLALGMGLEAVPPRARGVAPEAKPRTGLEVGPNLPQSATNGWSSRSGNLYKEPRHAAP